MITRFLSKRSITALALVLLAATTGLSQSTSGSITGTVKDGSGAPVSDATVLVNNPATNLTRRVTTNSSGVFTATQLPPGNYTIAVEKTAGAEETEAWAWLMEAIRAHYAGNPAKSP